MTSAQEGLAPIQLGSGRLFMHVRDAVIVADVSAGGSGVVVLWNPGAEALFGYSSEEAIGMPLETIIVEHWRPTHRAGVQRFRETGHGRVIDSPAAMAAEARRANGDPLSVEITLAPLPDVPGVRATGDGTDQNGEHLARLQRVERIETHETPASPALDLQRSAGPAEAQET